MQSKSILSAYAFSSANEAISTATPFVDKNSYLTIYIAAFIDYLAKNTDETLMEFTSFMGSDFSAPQKGSVHYMMNFINAMVANIEQKKPK